MSEKHHLFPNGVDDLLVQLNNIGITTNFSHMGQAEGIEITCSVFFKTKVKEILMHPDWEANKPTARLKELFPTGYFVYEHLKEEVVSYRFLMDYDRKTDSFVLKNTKKKEAPEHYYLNVVKQHYTEEAVATFEQALVQRIVQEYIKKIPYD